MAPALPPPADDAGPFSTGAALWAGCGGSAEGPIPGPCLIYVSGVADGARAAGGPGGGVACAGGPVEPERLADLVRRRLAADPESRRQSPASVVIAAMRRGFAC